MKKLAIMLLGIIFAFTLAFATGCLDSSGKDSTGGSGSIASDSQSGNEEETGSETGGETASETGSEETSETTSESEPSHIPLETAKLIVGDNTVELYVEDGREATFRAATAGRYEIGLKQASETVTFKIKTAGGTEDVDLPYNAYLEEGKEITLALASVAATEKDSVVLTVKEDNNNYVASVDIKNKLCPDKGKMSFITSEAYSNITEISFKAKTGTETSWWGISLAESKAAADLYVRTLKTTLPSTNGEWALFTYKFANGVCKITSTTGFSAKENIENKDYYIYVVGAKGEGFNENVMFDDFTVVSDGEVYVDDFQKGLNNGLFDIDDVWSEGGAPVSEVIENDIEISDKNNYVATIDVTRIAEDKTMSFITKAAYKNIEKISFKAKVDSTSWWGISLVEAQNTDIYTWSVGNFAAGNSTWTEYTYAFADGKCVITASDGATMTKDFANDKAYYIFYFGEKNAASKTTQIDDFTIVADGKTYVENFSGEQEEWIFETDGEVTKTVNNDVEVVVVKKNYVASVDIKNKLCSDDGKMSFITNKAYSNITEISFKAKTGTEASWWGISLATDASKASIYNMPLGTLAKTDGEWVTFTFTFADGKCTIKSSASENTAEKDVANADYYIYFIGARGENFNENVLIDDFIIVANGVTYKEDFQGEVSDWLFKVDGAVEKVENGTL